MYILNGSWRKEIDSAFDKNKRFFSGRFSYLSAIHKDFNLRVSCFGTDIIRKCTKWSQMEIHGSCTTRFSRTFNEQSFKFEQNETIIIWSQKKHTHKCRLSGEQSLRNQRCLNQHWNTYKFQVASHIQTVMHTNFPTCSDTDQKQLPICFFSVRWPGVSKDKQCWFSGLVTGSRIQKSLNLQIFVFEKWSRDFVRPIWSRWILGSS